MSDATLATSVAATDLIEVVQPGGITLATPTQIVDKVTLHRTDMAGTIPVQAVAAGTQSIAVSVAGLLATDRFISVTPAADLPAGLGLAWWRCAADGTLTVALSTGIVSVTLKSAIPLNVSVVR